MHLFGVRVPQLILPFGRRFSSMIISNLAEKFNGDFSRENVRLVFDNWNKFVTEKCPKEKLLVFNVKEGWEPVCFFRPACS